MTKKHFIKIAKSLNTVFKNDYLLEGLDVDDNFEGLVDALVAVCAENNPRFDKEKFLGVVYGDE